MAKQEDLYIMKKRTKYSKFIPASLFYFRDSTKLFYVEDYLIGNRVDTVFKVQRSYKTVEFPIKIVPKLVNLAKARQYVPLLPTENVPNQSYYFGQKRSKNKRKSLKKVGTRHSRSSIYTYSRYLL